MDIAGKEDRNRLLHLGDPLCDGNEPDSQEAEEETRGPQTGIRLPANRGFIDDLTMTMETHIQARWTLKALDETVTWARMVAKPKKSRM